MKTLFQAFMSFFSSTGTKLVKASDGADVAAEQLEALACSEQFANFAVEAQGARFEEIAAQVKAAGESSTAQAQAMQQELADLKQSIAAVAAANTELQAKLQTAQTAAEQANAQVDALSKVVGLQRSEPAVQRYTEQQVNDMLKNGTHAEQPNLNAKMSLEDSFRILGIHP